jgi:hypothetical protein
MTEPPRHVLGDDAADERADHRRQGRDQPADPGGRAQAAEASASTHVPAATSIRAIALITVSNQTDLT